MDEGCPPLSHFLQTKTVVGLAEDPPGHLLHHLRCVLQEAHQAELPREAGHVVPT